MAALLLLKRSKATECSWTLQKEFPLLDWYDERARTHQAATTKCVRFPAAHGHEQPMRFSTRLAFYLT